MKIRSWLLGLVAALSAGVAANATIIVPTNLGKGADAELREDETNVDVLSGVTLGGNRGGGTNSGAELATRAEDKVTVSAGAISNYFPTNDRSSVMYLKFDIGALPAAGDSFWNDKQVQLRLHTRNTNQAGGQRLWNPIPGGDPTNVADYRLMNFSIRALEPAATYVDDGAAALRTDRIGNEWNASQYKYDWTEGTGSNATDTSGITFYNAPGITPHCVVQGACSDASIPNSDPNSVLQTLGKYDDFDSNTRLIDDSWKWPNEAAAASYTTTASAPANLPSGSPLDYEDPNGALKQLLLDAKLAGRDTLTLMVHHGLDATRNQPEVGIVGTTPLNFLAHNYLTVPKEFAATAIANELDNSTGAFSPQLRIFVPEPTSAFLLTLGGMVLGLVRRRK